MVLAENAFKGLPPRRHELLSTLTSMNEGDVRSMTTFKVNGEERMVDVDPDTPLLWVIREELGLTGTKFGCGIAFCGACTVHVDGQTRRSCATPVAAVEGAEIVTIEGVSGPVSKAVQDAWIAIDVPQCGYCQSGQVMSAIALLSEIPKPTDQDIDRAMAGNICRCATYVRIRRAIHDAAKTLEG
jgi:isoquinoline 1-oxidoreductase subunit alpha